MIGIIDYKAGNIRSVINAFSFLGQECELVSDAGRLKFYDRVVLPGVGAFGEAMARLKAANFDEAAREFIATGKPFLGICLGMQLLFEQSEEFGSNPGLGLISGRVVKFDTARFEQPLKVPQVGWNLLNFTKRTPINAGLDKSEYLYFVHSYHVVCDEKFALAFSDYGYKFVSAVACENIYGFQPHPEKSHEAGLKILENFARL